MPKAVVTAFTDNRSSEMMTHHPPLLLPILLLLLLLTAARAGAGAGSPGSTPTPTPTPWPPRFHAKLLMDYRGNLSLADLWYDWPGGRNLHVIRYQLVGASDGPYYDAEWNNGTSFFYTPARRACRSAEVGVGILRPDWLSSHGAATYLGRATADGFDCYAWDKAGFIIYYEDVRTRLPVKWVFYTGRTAHVMSFEAGAALEDAEWQAPDYCFTDGVDDDGAAESTNDSVVSESASDGVQHDGEQGFFSELKMLLRSSGVHPWLDERRTRA